MRAHHATSSGDLRALDGRRHEVLGIIAGAATVLLGLSLFSYDVRGGANWIGPVGAATAGILATAFGVGAWVIPVELGLATVRLFSRRTNHLGVATAASTLLIVLVGCALLHLGFHQVEVFGGHLPGGVLGEVIGEVLRSLLGLTGAFVVGISVLMITLVLRTPVSIVSVGARVGSWAILGVRKVFAGAAAVGHAWREAKALERLEARAGQAAGAAGDDDDLGEEVDEELDDDAIDDGLGARDESALSAVHAFDPDGVIEVPNDGDETVDEEDERDAAGDRSAESGARRARGKERAPRIVAPVALSPRKPPQSIKLSDQPAQARTEEPFELPPLDLFDAPKASQVRLDEKTLRDNAARLVEKLAAYGVRGRVDEIHPGPVVTMYEFEPQSGTKVSKIAGLADDLAMALAAQKVRIVAPIPGKARVGFELPNEERQTVFFREILEDDRWDKLKAHLPIALGKDIAGQPVYGDLSKMPHLLVAGATGAGKSVGLNVMLSSLLAKKSPDEVRMLMIDPKVVELAVFDGIPHMLLPVVTDMKKAALALRWAVDEMERRYQLFADAGARNITTFNERVDRVLRGELAPEKLMPKRANKVRAQGPAGEEVLLDPVDGEAPNALDKPPEKLPFVVVVVDEFADLMMVAAKDVEACIARLAQKARAAGIHVILATQRPSVDVITGMIKANFPARIGFKVSQREDSKTILGRTGAEHLLGMGDMLMIPPGASDLKRVHCAYISEDEVRALCEFLRGQGDPIYDDQILKPRDDEDAGGGLGRSEASDDPLYDKAVAAVAQAGYCSISHLQRQLSVGYNKAAKLVERMEQEGVVGPASGKAGGRREVLIQAL